MTKRIVISGAPGTGKTSIIQELSRKGYPCKPEISREIIAHQIAINGNITPWQDLEQFSEIVLEKRITQHRETTSSTEFFDRSIIDVFAYLRHGEIEVKSEWKEIPNKYRYFNKVFMAPPWEDIYQKDNERKEDFTTSMTIHELMKKTYKDYGYQVFELPKTNINERVRIILSEIE